MGYGVPRFDDDFFQFRCAVKELDRRLATVLSNQAPQPTPFGHYWRREKACLGHFHSMIDK